MAAGGEAWSGRIGFILATVGSAVGIGSIWKFPYEVGANGGATFILFYLLGLALIVVPLMFAEFAIGRRGRADPRTSIAAIAAAHRASGRWALVGTVGAATAFLILSFYAVIGGWTIAYAAQTALAGLPAGPQAVQARYDSLLGSPLAMLGYHALFMAATAAIVARGIAGGIEAACKVLMPVLAALMLLLAAYALVEGDAAAALRFLFKLDLERMTAGAALDALGLGFFSIGVGLGLMITYAAYSGAEVNLKEVAVASVAADTAISFLAGLAVFPVVFAHRLDPAGGPGLVFVTLPLAFAQMPLGTLAAVAFFLLLFVAALASAISLLEIVVATLVQRAGLRRTAATAVAAGTCFAAGIATVLSFNLWAGWHPLALLPGFERSTVFDLLDYLTSNVLLPLGGFAIALFAGWAAPAGLLVEELRLGPAMARALRVLLRFVAPVAIAATAVSPWLIAAAKRA
jgi:NSS family neurotransmitter:Na+ symporter